jgi:SAM-dependent methyltransferase
MQRILWKYLRRLKGNFVETANRIRPVKSIFKHIYLNHVWGDSESVSGTGSKAAQTERITQLLPQLFEQYHVRTFLDVPCGDFNWMKNTRLASIQYRGCDIIDALIEKNNTTHARDNVKFFVANLLKDLLPQSDLVFCRDCLVHFSDRHVFKALENIKRSKSTFLLTTTFPEHRNKNIVTGSWRAINLQDRPFFFQKPIALFKEDFHNPASGIADKALGLWRINELP